MPAATKTDKSILTSRKTIPETTNLLVMYTKGTNWAVEIQGQAASTLIQQT
jgi:hypothetical protein